MILRRMENWKSSLRLSCTQRVNISFELTHMICFLQIWGIEFYDASDVDKHAFVEAVNVDSNAPTASSTPTSYRVADGQKKQQADLKEYLVVRIPSYNRRGKIKSRFTPT